MKVLITGIAGFIGYFVSKKLIEKDFYIVGIDNINDYYSPELKYLRLEKLGISKENINYGYKTKSNKYQNLDFIKINLEDRSGIEKIFKEESFDYVIHLAAQAGVRYSLKYPFKYIDSNINGFMTILEGVRNNNIQHFIFASSSSVYGANKKTPFSENDRVDNPVSLYAATKKSNELMAYTYSHLFGIPSTGLRFFTVYGPLGRPDMAYFKFTNAIFNDREIEVYNFGKMKRDFTYIDDIVEGVFRLIQKVPENDNITTAPFKVYNIGNNHPVELLYFIEILEREIGKTAKKKFLPIQAGDVVETYADISELEKAVGFRPTTSIEEGLKRFVDWYKGEYMSLKAGLC